MDAKDLMIGDWVLCPDNMQRQVRYLQVRPSVIGIGGSSYDEDEIQPIPLTPEILEQNGLEQINTDYYDLDVYEANDGLWRVVYSNLECSGFDESVLVSSVHELQHFLRLCGIDKEIEI